MDRNIYDRRFKDLRVGETLWVKGWHTFNMTRQRAHEYGHNNNRRFRSKVDRDRYGGIITRIK